MLKTYEIIDNKGVIHSSTDKEEMEIAFDCMVHPEQYDEQEIEIWKCDWNGDLKLIKVLNVSR